MLPIALGLGSAAFIGVGDFAAGVASRRISPLLVGFWSQVVGAAVGLVLLLLLRPQLAEGQLPWGLAAGLATGIGLACLYQAMAVGAISLVAPLVACSVVFPVIYAVAGGETLTPLATLGIVAIIAGVVLASLQPAPVPGDPTELGLTGDRRAVIFSIAAALAFGLYFILVDVAPQQGAWGTLWTAGPARLASLGVQAVLLVLAMPGRLTNPGRYAPHVAAAGALDQLSLVLLGIGATTSAYGIVSALMGLYPVITALLGVILLGERLTRIQTGGATLALAGVMLVSL